MQYNSVSVPEFILTMEHLASEKLVGDRILEAAASKVASAQELCRERKANADTGAVSGNPPLLPPADAPSDVEDDPNEPVCVALESKPLSKNISVYKLHAKVTIEGEHRKFEVKDWGQLTEGVPQAAASAFEAEVFGMLAAFEALSRNPAGRKALLESAGLDEKHWAKGKTIASQREALIRQCMRGKVAEVEQKIATFMLKRAFGTNDTSAVSIKPTSAGFHAFFSSGKENVDKIFPKIFLAIRWLQSLGMAGKDRCLQSFGFCWAC